VPPAGFEPAHPPPEAGRFPDQECRERAGRSRWPSSASLSTPAGSSSSHEPLHGREGAGLSETATRWSTAGRPAERWLHRHQGDAARTAAPPGCRCPAGSPVCSRQCLRVSTEGCGRGPCRSPHGRGCVIGISGQNVSKLRTSWPACVSCIPAGPSYPSSAQPSYRYRWAVVIPIPKPSTRSP
jgi:hypothetical protein